MGRAEFIYTALFLAFVLQQTYWWSKILHWWKHVLYPTPVLLWSLFFSWRLYEVSFSSTLYLPLVLFWCLHLIIGRLLFPNFEGLDYQSSYTYIDVYEELRQRRFWIFGLASLAELLGLYQEGLMNGSFSPSAFVGLLLFLLAMLTEHKGLMLVWVWLGLGMLWWW